MAIVDSNIFASDAEDAVSKRHLHANMAVLDQVTESGGKLAFNGSPVDGAPVSGTANQVLALTDATTRAWQNINSRATGVAAPSPNFSIEHTAVDPRWYRVATLTPEAPNYSYHLIMHVYDTYRADEERFGICKVSVFLQSGSPSRTGNIFWESMKGFNPSDFVVAWTTAAPTMFYLYVRCPTRWHDYRFDVISGSRNAGVYGDYTTTISKWIFPTSVPEPLEVIPAELGQSASKISLTSLDQVLAKEA